MGACKFECTALPTCTHIAYDSRGLCMLYGLQTLTPGKAWSFHEGPHTDITQVKTNTVSVEDWRCHVKQQAETPPQTGSEGKDQGSKAGGPGLKEKQELEK